MACTTNNQVKLIFTSILLIAILYFLYVLIKTRCQQSKTKTISSNLTQNVLTYSFSALVLATVIAWISQDIYRCTQSNELVANTLDLLGILLCLAQYLLFFVLLFHRLCYVFGDTPYAVSTCTKFTFYASFVALLIAGCITGAFQYNQGEQAVLYIIFAVVSLIGFLLVMAIIIYSFLLRLIRVWTKSDSDFLQVITKHFILATCSIGSITMIILYVITGIWVDSSAYEEIGVRVATAINLMVPCWFIYVHWDYVRLTLLCMRTYTGQFHIGSVWIGIV